VTVVTFRTADAASLATPADASTSFASAGRTDAGSVTVDNQVRASPARSTRVGRETPRSGRVS
jgi:hypothetical protein